MRSRRISILLLAIAGLAVLPASVAFSCFMRSPQPVTVALDHIHVEITDQVAVKTYNCTFKNPNATAVVGGTCYMELEPGAQVDKMTVTVDGKEMRAEILDVDRAKKVFTEMIKEGGSPALLEYYGNQLIQTQVPKVPAGGTVVVKLTYTTVLKRRGDLVRLQMLNTNPKTLQQPLESASVTVNIRSEEPIKNVYSPTHEIKIGEKEDWDVSISWSQENYLPKHPFVLYYQHAREQVGAALIAHREPHEDGTFMMMLSPTVGSGMGAVTDDQILPKDVVFCVDTSGSMLEGNKMEQAREALKYCISNLRPGDRFNIVDFSTDVRSFNESGLVEFDEKNKVRALGYASDLYAGGGTAIDEALARSLKDIKSGDRLKMILFATDGLPTVGERNAEEILKKLAKENTEDVRLFVFGEGFDVNTKLLDFLALNNRGEADYIRPDEKIQDKISHFFDRVGAPIMTDLELSFEGVNVKDVYPRRVADIYRGEQVVIFGRYQGSGEQTVKLTAYVGGQRQTFDYRLYFPEVSNDDRSAFIPRLWAGRKVEFLLNELRKGAEDKELVDEVTRLAKRYGIVTPYTSFLMADDMVAQGEKTLAARFRGQFGEVNGAAAGAPGPSFDAPTSKEEREKQFEAADRLGNLRRDAAKSGGARALDEFVEQALKDQGRDGTSLNAIRYIGARTFYPSGGVWYDSRFDMQKNKVESTIKVGSDEYFNLLAENDDIAKYLALENVVLEVDGKWYRVESGE